MFTSLRRNDAFVLDAAILVRFVVVELRAAFPRSLLRREETAAATTLHHPMSVALRCAARYMMILTYWVVARGA